MEPPTNQFYENSGHMIKSDLQNWLVGPPFCAIPQYGQNTLPLKMHSSAYNIAPENQLFMQPVLPPHTPENIPASVNNSYDGQPKKPQRTLNACDRCRNLKRKCTGAKPKCKSCENNNMSCIYVEVPPQNLDWILDRLTHLENRVEVIEKRSGNANSNTESTTKQPDTKGSTKDRTLTGLQQNSLWPSMTESVKHFKSQNGGKKGVDGAPLSSSELAIPAGYRAAASSILSWNLVAKIVGDETTYTVWRLAGLYMQYVNIVYPILTPTQLGLLIQGFLNTSLNYSEPAGLKRKRSAPESPQSSIERAIVLLILAIGQKFDDAPPAECEGLASGSTTFQHGYPSPENVEKSWMGAFVDQNSLYEPGQKYFATATDIIGRHTGGNSFCHVQAYILASLYSLDLQRHNYLLEAARALQVFLQHNFQLFKSTGWNNAVLIAFWTQRLLESELTPELAISESNLRIWDRSMPFPDVEQAEKDFANKGQVYTFMAQLELRKHLETVHKELHQQRCQEKADTPALHSVLSNLESIIDKQNLDLWKMYEAYQLKETDSKSILAIRMEAKFFAAMAITFHPYLKMILELGDLEVKISEKAGNYAQHCITALEQSIMVSNSIKNDRLITHAQCCNVIILLAASLDASVKRFINYTLLEGFVNQTLGALKTWPPSALDQKYLKVLELMALRAGLLQSQNSYHQ